MACLIASRRGDSSQRNANHGRGSIHVIDHKSLLRDGFFELTGRDSVAHCL
jgi:hypothetical protein